MRVIKLNQGMPDLLNPSKDWKHVVRFTSSTGDKKEVNYTYADREINFPIPSAILLNDVYSFSLVNIPIN